MPFWGFVNAFVLIDTLQRQGRRLLHPYVHAVSAVQAYALAFQSSSNSILRDLRALRGEIQQVRSCEHCALPACGGLSRVHAQALVGNPLSEKSIQ